MATGKLRESLLEDLREMNARMERTRIIAGEVYKIEQTVEDIGRIWSDTRRPTAIHLADGDVSIVPRAGRSYWYGAFAPKSAGEGVSIRMIWNVSPKNAADVSLFKEADKAVLNELTRHFADHVRFTPGIDTVETMSNPAYEKIPGMSKWKIRATFDPKIFAYPDTEIQVAMFLAGYHGKS